MNLSLVWPLGRRPGIVFLFFWHGAHQNTEINFPIILRNGLLARPNQKKRFVYLIFWEHKKRPNPEYEWPPQSKKACSNTCGSLELSVKHEKISKQGEQINPGMCALQKRTLGNKDTRKTEKKQCAAKKGGVDIHATCAFFAVVSRCGLAVDFPKRQGDACAVYLNKTVGRQSGCSSAIGK